MFKWWGILGLFVAAVLVVSAPAGAAQRVVLAEMFGGTW
jgi:hypothetical protein